MFYNRKSIKVVTPASQMVDAERVISVDDMKTYLRVDVVVDDDLIGELIDTATEAARNYIKRSILLETLELTLDQPSNNGTDEFDRLGAGTYEGTRQSILGNLNEIDLPYPPISSIASVKTYGTDNTESTMSSSIYELDETGGRFYLNEGNVWPSNLRRRESVKIRYISGYGATPAAIPMAIKQAIRQHVAFMYECREACEMPPSCKALLQSYRILDQLGFM